MSKYLRSTMILVVVVLFSLPVRADLPVEKGMKLREVTEGDFISLRQSCSNQYCLWRTRDYLGACSGEDCANYLIVLTNREGVELGAVIGDTPEYHYVSRRSIAHFVASDKVEVVHQVELCPRNQGSRGWNIGFDANLTWTTQARILSNGAEFGRISNDWTSPQRHQQLTKLLELSSEAETPKVLEIPENIIRKAKISCAGPEIKVEDKPLHAECHGEECFLVYPIHHIQSNDIQWVCPVFVRKGNAQPLPIASIINADRFWPQGSRYCFGDSRGGIYGGPADVNCIQRAHPERMAFLDSKNLHLEWASSYPLRKLSQENGWSLAPVVHAATAAHVVWGLDRWRNDRDLSLTWQAARTTDALKFKVEVEDDTVVPLKKEGASVHSDHIELTLQSKTARIKFGVLLTANGIAQVRLWQKCANKKRTEVNEEYPAAGTWKTVTSGYSIEFEIPLKAIRDSLVAKSVFDFSIVASDADQAKQKVLLGTAGQFFLWDEYPPTLEEYIRVQNETEIINPANWENKLDENVCGGR